jgi:quinol monooxygenase YgiN
MFVMVRVVAKNFIKPELIPQIEPIFRELIEATHKNDKGCIEYRLYKDPKEEGAFVFIEEWESQEALNSHAASEHYKRLIPNVRQAASRKGEILVLEEFK